MALSTDKAFKPTAQLYAKDEDKFFSDFSKVFSKYAFSRLILSTSWHRANVTDPTYRLIHLGVPESQLSEVVQLKKLEDQQQS